MRFIAVVLIVIGILNLAAIALFPALGLSGIFSGIAAIITGIGFARMGCH